MFGALQHGASVLRLVDVTRDAALVQAAHAEAAALLEADPELAAPEHAALAAELEVFFAGAAGDEDDGEGRAGEGGAGEGGTGAGRGGDVRKDVAGTSRTGRGKER